MKGRTLSTIIGALFAAAVGVGALSCREPVAVDHEHEPQLDWDADDCWPRGPNCQDRPLLSSERQRFQNAINTITTSTNFACGLIKSEAQYHLDRPTDLNGDGFMIWTQAPFQAFGDMHNEPDIAHVTQSSLNGSDALVRAVIVHEIAHDLGYDHSQTTQLELDCAGAALPL
jgi:hypothetical protein